MYKGDKQKGVELEVKVSSFSNIRSCLSKDDKFLWLAKVLQVKDMTLQIKL